MDSLVLVANPGSASRKYALFDDDRCLAKIHFELERDEVIYSVEAGGTASPTEPADISHLTFAAGKIFSIFNDIGVLQSKEQVKTIGVRVVAPASYFQTDQLLDKEALQKLNQLEPRASLHINASLQEAHVLERTFPGARTIGVSDSAIHSTMPAYASRYALPITDADKLDIKRFGYHGLSVESVVDKLKQADKLPKRLVICHLGSGASVTAIKSGKSVDTSMGYSPLEGLMMATRSGNLDVTAAEVLQTELGLSHKALQDYLNHSSGLLGVSGSSSDIRTLLELERSGDNRSKEALDMYVYRVQQAVGQMTATLGGIDALVFTGTVGERSAPIRRRVVQKLMYLGLGLDGRANHEPAVPEPMRRISPDAHPAKIYIVDADEYSVIAKHAVRFELSS